MHCPSLLSEDATDTDNVVNDDNENVVGDERLGQDVSHEDCRRADDSVSPELYSARTCHAKDKTFKLFI